MTFHPDLTSDATISPDGSTVVFLAEQTVGGAKHWHVIVRSVRAGALSRADVSNTGVVGNDDAMWPRVSADGRHVAFFSRATNLAAGIHPTTDSINGGLYVRDLDRHTTTLVSVTPAGLPMTTNLQPGSISSDGRYVAFAAFDDRDEKTSQAWLRDVAQGTTTLISASPQGDPGNGSTYDAEISPHGHVVSFDSSASNLVTGDTNGQRDVFLRDLRTNRTKRISTGPAGAQLPLDSWAGRFSTDGAFVTFSSDAQLTTDACQGGHDATSDSDNRRNVYLYDLASGQVIHPVQSCKQPPYQRDTGMAACDGARAVAVSVVYTEAAFLVVRKDGKETGLSWISAPTSMTSDCRYIGISHFDPGSHDAIPGAVIWDTVKHTATAAWEFGGQ